MEGALANGFANALLHHFRGHDRKESRNEAALEKSGRRAVSTITRGLATNDFKKVYQGLKRLHNAEQKLSNMGGTVGGLNDKTYITDRLERVVSECVPDEKNSNASKMRTYLKHFVTHRDAFVDRHSDSKTLFHRMLTDLARVGLISRDRVDLRTKRIKAQDNKIKETLELLQSKQVSFLSKQVEDGNADADAIYDLGLLYRDGEGVDKNLEKAADMFRKAADHGHPHVKHELYHLGRCYRYGHGVDKNLEKAADMFRKAADCGDYFAKVELYELGKCYRDGRGVDKNLETAVSLFRQAADYGYSSATHELGKCYRDGHGVDQDLEKAADMFRQAADCGDFPAMYDLGVCYRDGKGVDQDLEKAADMFRQARAEFALDELAQMRRSAGTGID